MSSKKFAAFLFIFHVNFQIFFARSQQAYLLLVIQKSIQSLEIWIFYVCTSSTLLHLPPFRFHYVGECWDRTQDICDFAIGGNRVEMKSCVNLYHFLFFTTLYVAYVFIWKIFQQACRAVF